jgi:hypothetical protein
MSRMVSDAALNRDFLDLLAALLEAGAQFVVVGAHAMAVHGVPRSTGDLDVLVRPDPDNATRVLDALRAFGAPVEEHGLKEQDLCALGTVYQIGLPPRRIDVLTQISGVPFDEAWAGRLVVTVGGLDVPFLGRESLVRNKRAAGRDKDLVDVKTLTERAGETD